MSGSQSTGGYCATCERDHLLECTEAAGQAAQALMQELEARGSIELAGVDAIIGSAFGAGSGSGSRSGSNDPRLTTDALHTECGQMFGVLVCRDAQGNTQILRAFSGSFNGESHVPGWAPPIHPARFTAGRRTTEEEKITALGATIAARQREATRAQAALDATQAMASADLEETRRAYAVMRAQRSAERERLAERAVAAQDPEEIRQETAALEDQARHTKAELRRAKAVCAATLEPLRARVTEMQTKLEALRTERREMSRRLMRDRHAGYYLTNFQRTTRPLTEAYAGPGGIPTGTGDCCAPKLLQLAARRGLLPVGLAEFWWGASPTGTPRRHRQFYAPCADKCTPILGFMLCGAAAAEPPPHV